MKEKGTGQGGVVGQSRGRGGADGTARLFVEQDEAEHGPAEAPLVGALFKEHQLEQRRQQRGQQLWPLPEVLRERLRAATGTLPESCNAYPCHRPPHTNMMSALHTLSTCHLLMQGDIW